MNFDIAHHTKITTLKETRIIFSCLLSFLLLLGYEHRDFRKINNTKKKIEEKKRKSIETKMNMQLLTEVIQQ